MVAINSPKGEINGTVQGGSNMVCLPENVAKAIQLIEVEGWRVRGAARYCGTSVGIIHYWQGILSANGSVSNSSFSDDEYEEENSEYEFPNKADTGQPKGNGYRTGNSKGRAHKNTGNKYYHRRSVEH